MSERNSALRTYVEFRQLLADGRIEDAMRLASPRFHEWYVDGRHYRALLADRYAYKEGVTHIGSDPEGRLMLVFPRDDDPSGTRGQFVDIEKCDDGEWRIYGFGDWSSE